MIELEPIHNSYPAFEGLKQPEIAYAIIRLPLIDLTQP